MGGEKEGENASDLFDKGEVNKDSVSPAVSDLQKRLENECDRRKEERFIWICALVVVFDMYAFSHMQTWAGPVIVGIIEIILLIIAGKLLGINIIYTLVKQIIDKWDGKTGRSGCTAGHSVEQIIHKWDGKTGKH